MITISLKFLPMGPVNNIPKITDAYMRHSASMSLMCFVIGKCKSHMRQSAIRRHICYKNISSYALTCVFRLTYALWHKVSIDA